jgi:hypothetical protein
MIPMALFSLLFETKNRKRPPAGRQEKLKRQIINCVPIIFCFFCRLEKQSTTKFFNMHIRKLIKIPFQLIWVLNFHPCFQRPRRILIIADSVEFARAPAVRFDP